MLFPSPFWERSSLLGLIDYLLFPQFLPFFFPTPIISQPNSSIPPSDSVTMSSQLPPGGILFDTGKDKDRDKNGKRPQSMHFPLPFTPTMSPIVYPATTSNTSKMNKENKLDMDKGKGVDDADTPNPVQFPMPNNRTAFLCPHGLHISDTIADDAGPGPGPSSQNYLQTRCLVCDVMREYHPYQPQTADPTVGEQWIRYMVSSNTVLLVMVFC
jgi:hypothetical protein